MLLTGSYARAIDEKLRVAIPKPLREILGCPIGGSLYVGPGTDGSLAIYTEETLARWGERLEKVPPTQKDVRAFTRLFYSQAQRTELDRQGRIRIPVELAAMAHLEKEAMLLGVQDHLELWAADQWRSYLAEKQAHYDELAEAAFGTLSTGRIETSSPPSTCPQNNLSS
jgi:MraZ protein